MTTFSTALKTAAFTFALTLGTIGGALAGAPAYDRSIDIYNDGSNPIWSVQISHIDAYRWGPDLLGQYVIPAGAAETLWLDQHEGYCRFDVLVTYGDGSEIVVWDMNLCDGGEIITDGREVWSA